MSGTAIEIKVTGFDELVRKANRMAGLSMRGVLEQIGGVVESQTRQRFETERDPEGRPWRPLAAQTLLRKAGGSRKVYKKRGGMRKHGMARLGGQRILQEKGTLVDSIHFEVAHDQVAIGTNMVYGAIHNFGGAGAGRPQIPQRQYLGINAQNRKDIKRAVEHWLKEVIG